MKRRPKRPPDHRCDICRLYGGWAPIFTPDGRVEGVTYCPNLRAAIPPAPPALLDHARRAAGEREGE